MIDQRRDYPTRKVKKEEYPLTIAFPEKFTQAFLYSLIASRKIIIFLVGRKPLCVLFSPQMLAMCKRLPRMICAFCFPPSATVVSVSYDRAAEAAAKR